MSNQHEDIDVSAKETNSSPFIERLKKHFINTSKSIEVNLSGRKIKLHTVSQFMNHGKPQQVEVSKSPDGGLSHRTQCSSKLLKMVLTKSHRATVFDQGAVNKRFLQ